MFGARIVRAFETVKDAFDPSNMLNPGRIVRPPRMDDRTLFRYDWGYAPVPHFTPKLDWSDHPGPLGGMLGAVEMCNNNGTCRAFDAGVMCPSYRVTRDETHVTRGRANTLRLALTGQLGAGAMASDAVADAMSLCVSCKACKRECPTGVDMAKMKIEALAARFDRNGLTRRDRLIAELPRYAKLVAPFAPLANLRNRFSLLRRLGERATGLAAARPLPAWRRDAFRDSEVAAFTPTSPRGDVILLADTFNRWFEPENLRAALRVLTAAGYRVRMPEVRGHPLCCGRTYLSVGMVDKARGEARRTLDSARRRSAGDRTGTFLPADAARRVPLAAAGCSGRFAGRPRISARRIPGARKTRVAAEAFTRDGACAWPLPPEIVRRLLIRAGCAEAGSRSLGKADSVVLLRHGGLVRLSGGDAGGITRDGRGRTAAGGARRRGRGYRGRRWHLVPSPDPRSGRTRGDPFRQIARAGVGMMTPDEVLDFWFAGDPAAHRKVWFEKDAEFDAACSRFADALRDARAGAFDHWTDTPRGTLALIILLDQFSRNLHRGSPEAFAADAKALGIARSAVARGFDQELGPMERMFVYLPFEHSENLADQDESVRLFATLREALGEDSIRYGESHRDVIRRFGRFPHRNAALGRVSTPEELAYLAQPGAGF